MKIKIDYGKNGIYLNIPSNSTVLRPLVTNPLKNPSKTIMNSSSNPINSQPLETLYKKGMVVGVSVCDHTRAQPRNEIIRSIIKKCDGIKKNNLIVFIATGSHRQSSESEIHEMFDRDILSMITIVNHNSEKFQELKYIGKTSKKTSVFLNKLWMECDLKITTGFVEPHFFAGFSGGPKMIAPGLAGIDTITTLHNYERIINKNSTWGIIEGNPIHEEIVEISRLAKPDFSIDLTLNRNNEITNVFSGNLQDEHMLACKYVKKNAMQKTDKLYDIVITSNSGYPLDQNIYQAIKGVSAAAQITKPGGSIISVSECIDGFPYKSNYEKLLKTYNNPKIFLEYIKENDTKIPDQWQFQIQSQIQIKSKIYLYSKLGQKDVSDAHLLRAENIEDLIEDLSSKITNPSICVLPEGPQTIPLLVN